jgi:hypothetical protein
VVGMSDFRTIGSRLFRATPQPRPDTLAPRSEARHETVGRRFESQPVRISRPKEPALRSWWILNQTVRRHSHRLGPIQSATFGGGLPRYSSGVTQSGESFSLLVSCPCPLRLG